MMMDVAARARALATFRFVSVRLMETAAAWTPTTPEMEVKVVFGRHIWDFAQHADALGRRTFELRQALHFTLPPALRWLALLDHLAQVRDTAPRLAALYDVVLPGLERRLRDYLAATDPVLDGPSHVLLDRILADLPRMRAQADAVRRELNLPRAALPELQAREAAAELLPA